MFSKVNINKDDRKGLEYRHSTYCESSMDRKNDALVVKEYIHTKDGERIPNLRILENFERPFYITKKGYRDHNDKLEYEDLDKVDLFKTNQRNLVDAIAKRLGHFGPTQGLKHICRSPYVYGADIGPGPILHYNYKKKWPDQVGAPARVAAFDIETDVVHGTEDIILSSVSFKDKVICTINKSWLDCENDPMMFDRLKARVNELLKEHIDKRKIKIEYKFCENEAVVAQEAFKKAHEWMPDFVSIWNINFDLPKVLQALDKYQVDPASVFSDPSVPNQYKFFKYKEGSRVKKTQDGTVMSLHFADRWHIATCPSSFYFLDSMCLYKRIRTARGNVSSYSLDAALDRHLNLSKLKFDVGEVNSMLEWHYKMQKYHKFEYIAYNIFDCIGLELLDEKIGDISLAFPGLVGISDYGNFNKNPRRIVDDLHFYTLENGRVIATTSDEVSEELDRFVVNMRDWIVTLGSYLIDENGIPIISDLPSLISMIRTHLADLDVEGTYPTLEAILNISKETTHLELAGIKGLTELDRRMVGINMTGGKSNAVEICTTVFKAPSPTELLDLYRKQKNMV